MAMLLFPAPRNESVGVVVEIFFVVFCVCGISVQSFVQTLRMAVLRSVYRSGDLAIGTFVVVDLSPIDVSLSRTKSRIRCLAQQGPRGAGSLNLIHHCLLHPSLPASPMPILMPVLRVVSHSLANRTFSRLGAGRPAGA
jgi:hypothetical protein